MLGLLKQKLHEATKPPESAKSTPPEPSAFEVGKEVMIRDPFSGEFVYRMAMTPENRKKIFDIIGRNAGVGQRLINLSVNLAAILRQLDLEDKSRIESEKAIETVVNEIRDEMKIPKVWGLNMALGVFERREPPEG